MSQYTTDFGSIHQHRRGKVSVIDDDPRRYVFSNLFHAAAVSKPWERVAVAKNFEYVIESVRAEGVSPWYAAAHDEFAISMDGRVRIDFVKLDDPDAVVDPESEGGHPIAGEPVGRAMGHVVLGKGHMAMLPVGAAYRFTAEAACTVILQTIDGPATVHKWAEICQK